MKTLRVMALVIALAMVVAACAAEPAATTAAGGTDTTAAGGTDTTAAGGTDTTAAGGTDTTAAGGTETTAGAAGETPYEHLNQAMAGEFEGTEVVIVGAMDRGGGGFIQRRPSAFPRCDRNRRGVRVFHRLRDRSADSSRRG